MFPHPSKLAGPVKHSTPDSDTLILTCDRSLKWPAIFALPGLGTLLASIWDRIWLVFFFYCSPFTFAALYFAVLRANVILSKKNETLVLRPMLKLFKSRGSLCLPFSRIREFLVEAEFEAGVGAVPFIWHLTAITIDGERHRLTWHFIHDPIRIAGQEAARITGKPLREESDPWMSSTWSRWGWKFLS
jgi:hypothetical protein